MSTLIWLSVFYLIIIIGARFLENSFIYFPTKYPAGRWDAGKYGLLVEDVWLLTEDGLNIHGWYVKSNKQDGHESESAQAGDHAGGSHKQDRQDADSQPKHKGSLQSTSLQHSDSLLDEEGRIANTVPEFGLTVLFFHGNGGNLTDRIEKLVLLSSLGLDVFIIDYRGYGRSEGRPDEAGIYKDGYAAYKYLVDKRKLSADKIIIFGESLGGAVALAVAAKFPVGGLILEATMTRARDLAVRALPIVPPSLYLKTKFDNLTRIAKITAPLLIIYGTKDTTIPPSHSVRLFEAANEPKELLAIEGAHHNDLFVVGGEKYTRSIRRFLQKVVTRS